MRLLPTVPRQPTRRAAPTPPRGRPLTRPQAWVVGVAGVALLVGWVTELAPLAPLTLAAALIAPGYVIVSAVAAALEDDVDPWIVWTLRLLVSVALWTVLGTALVETGLDPRRSGLAIGPGLIAVAAWTLWLRPGRAARSAAVLTKAPTLSRPPVDAPGWAGRNRRQCVVVAVAALAFVGSIGAAVSVSQAGVAPPPYVAVALDPPQLTVGGNGATPAGTVSGRLLVRNGTPHEHTVTVSVVVDGVTLWRRPVAVPAGGTARVPFTVSTGACWRHLAISAGGLTAALRPRPLTAAGPPTCG